MMPTAILVTGGAGYIGSHTCKALAKAGYLPVTLDNLRHGRAEAVRWGPLIKADIGDHAAMVQALRQYKIAAILHFAALIEVGQSMREPLTYLAHNAGKSFSLLSAMVEAGVDRIVFSSTCATYGTPLTPVLDETHPQSPVSAYGASKLMVEQALGWAGIAHGLRSVSLRYFNAAGADLDGETGESHQPETHLIPLVLQAALGQRGPIDVYGTDWPTRDGTCLRDYIHVADLADAHVRALAYLQDGGRSTALNLGTGDGHTVREVITGVEQVIGRSVPYRDQPRRAGDPAALVADPRLARTVLGWRPAYSDLPTILRSAARWAGWTD